MFLDSGEVLTLYDLVQIVKTETLLELVRLSGQLEEVVEREPENAKAALDDLVKILDDRHKALESANLEISLIAVSELKSSLQNDASFNWESLAAALSELSNTVRREMKSSTMLCLDPQYSKYYQHTSLFGDKVTASFPNASYDIEEAGNCLALRRSTACVYHAMRVLEHGLCALADRFNVPFEHKTWNDIIEPIEKEIRQIKSQPVKPPNWKDEEQFYSEAAAQFMHFKNAWRNFTAHKQFKYTEDEADAIFRHVRDFMYHIAKRLEEKKPANDVCDAA